MGSCFNPLAPRGARPICPNCTKSCEKVSIHSPLAGRDTKSLKALTGTTWFQSTRPSRGETYAPHAGTHSGKRFNPLAPRGARPGNLTLYPHKEEVSIHSPLAGRDSSPAEWLAGLCVSIHSPLAGRDIAAQSGVDGRKLFQSTRPSRGETRRRAV